MMRVMVVIHCEGGKKNNNIKQKQKHVRCLERETTIVGIKGKPELVLLTDELRTQFQRKMCCFREQLKNLS